MATQHGPNHTTDTSLADSVEDQPQTNWDGEEGHGWAPNAPGSGGAKAAAKEADRKAYAADPDTPGGVTRPGGGFTSEDNPAAAGVDGQSESRSGETIRDQDGQEPGRHDKGTKGEANRPYGGCGARDTTSVGDTTGAGATESPGQGGQGG